VDDSEQPGPVSGIDHPRSALTLSGDEMRRLGERLVELLIEHFEGVAGEAPVLTAEPGTLDDKLGPPPTRGRNSVEVLDQVARDVLPFRQRADHPRFFARIPSPSNYVGAIADALAAGFNVFAGSWAGGSGAAAVELAVLDWLRSLTGMPPGTDGVLVSGGSVATLTALAAARIEYFGDEPFDDAVVYVSDQTHASVARALRLLGFRSAQVRTLRSDEQFRLNADALAVAAAEDRAAGRRPFCVVATAGTTNTGAVDSLDELADACAEGRMWLHVDGAYGAPAALTPRGRALLGGLGRADSLALDPHKWLFQPYEAGCLLVRHRGMLERCFAMFPEYLADVAGGAQEVNFRDRSPQLTRGFRALKIWMTLQVFGADAIQAGIEHGIDMAEHAERLLRARPEWEIVTPAQLAIVSFRPHAPRLSDSEVDALCRRIVDGCVREQFAAISSTQLRGRTVLRLCTINPRTTRRDVEMTIERLTDLANV
jgi:aromatic-L-amino-acid decarboxylase